MSQNEVGSVGSGEQGAGWEQGEPQGFLKETAVGSEGAPWSQWEEGGPAGARRACLGSQDQGVRAQVSASPSFPRRPPCQAMNYWAEHTGCPALWSPCSGGQRPLWVEPTTGGSPCLCGPVPAVPRLLFEDWTHEDFQSVWDSEDEIEELSKTMVQVAKVRPGAPRGHTGCPGLPLGQGPQGRGPSLGRCPAVQCWASWWGRPSGPQGLGWGGT